jgi:hypothetical protein
VRRKGREEPRIAVVLAKWLYTEASDTPAVRAMRSMEVAASRSSSCRRSQGMAQGNTAI